MRVMMHDGLQRLFASMEQTSQALTRTSALLNLRSESSAHYPEATDRQSRPTPQPTNRFAKPSLAVKDLNPCREIGAIFCHSTSVF